MAEQSGEGRTEEEEDGPLNGWVRIVSWFGPVSFSFFFFWLDISVCVANDEYHDLRRRSCVRDWLSHRSSDGAGWELHRLS